MSIDKYVSIEVPRFRDESGKPTCEGCALFRPCSLQPATTGWCHAPRWFDDLWLVRNKAPHLECPLWMDPLSCDTCVTRMECPKRGKPCMYHVQDLAVKQGGAA